MEDQLFRAKSKVKNLNFEVDEHKESLNTLIASKFLGVDWNEKSDTFYFDSSDLGTFLSKRINTKRYLLQAAGRLFDPVGFIGPYTIRIKCLIQEIWCLGLNWDDKLPKQLEVSWNKWCNEIHYLSEINIPRYYFQNFLPSNATTIQLHCFSDASKKAYGTFAYLRLELNDGNIISSFVASKGRVAPLKTFSIPRLELMGALFIARRSKLSVIWSENAMNFKGERNILNDWNKICKSNTIQLFSADEGIEWNFIPPASPHFGGL
ncbi:reverse transcriptase domain-containing protein [Trichonephila clavipes]|nr:reverse transcriptase domain-containing protein [Trichonephila clavipes]